MPDHIEAGTSVLGETPMKSLQEEILNLPLPEPQYSSNVFGAVYTAAQVRSLLERAASLVAQKQAQAPAGQGAHPLGELDAHDAKTMQLAHLYAQDAAIYWEMPSLAAGCTSARERMEAARKALADHLASRPGRAETTELTQALKDAATSLETISLLSGRKTYGDPPIESFMGTFTEVRQYAAARAQVARAALSQGAKTTCFGTTRAAAARWASRFASCSASSSTPT